MSLAEHSDRLMRSRNCPAIEASGISLLTSIEDWGASQLRAEWEAVLEQFDDRLSMFQSPQWFEHINATEPSCHPSLVCVRDEEGRLVGFVPLVPTRLYLEYSAKRIKFGKTRLSLLEIPGGAPPLPDDELVYDRLFETLQEVARGYEGIYMRMVPTSSFCWRYLNESPLVRSSFALILPEGLSKNRFTELPRTFKEYLARFKSKKRCEIHRNIRLLREQGGGELKLRRFEAPGEVDSFLELAAPVARSSWQAQCSDDRVDTTPFWRRKLTDLAERGLLRAYVLTAADCPCAFALGYQGRHTLHHIQTGYEPSFAKHSPGTVLHYLLYEDLILSRPPRRTSFGHGDGLFKREFGNVQSEEASVFLINHRLISKLKIHSYSAFKSVIRMTKAWARPGPASGTASVMRQETQKPRSSSHAPTA